MVLRGLVAALAVFLLIVTFLPLIRTDAGWVRIWDFPRLQLVVGLLAVLAALPWLRPWPTPLLVLLGAGTLAALLYNAVRILPYFPFAEFEVARAAGVERSACLDLMTVNVFQYNRDAERLLELVKRRDPDILFLVETDAWWHEKLRDIMPRYKHVAAEPRGNTYGLVFMTRLEPIEPIEIRHLVSEVIPSVRARLALSNSAGVTIYGLHPEPPTPLQSSGPRDLELVRVAREVAQISSAVIVIGDLNDVAWSPTTRAFKRISGLKDPRVGRGLYATFHAKIPIARWPLDHLFHSADMKIAALEVLPDVGSDHFPVYARLCVGE